MTVLCICQTGLREIRAIGETRHLCVSEGIRLPLKLIKTLVSSIHLSSSYAYHRRLGRGEFFHLNGLEHPSYLYCQCPGSETFRLGPRLTLLSLKVGWTCNSPEHPAFWLWVIPDLWIVLGQKTNPLQQYSHYQDVQCRHFEERAQNGLWASYIAYGVPPLNGLITL